MIFITCEEKPKLTNTKYGPRTNDPVNLSLTERIQSSREHYYPDNEGIPTIKFYRDGKQFHQWMFEKHEEPLRDKVFQRLVNLKERSSE